MDVPDLVHAVPLEPPRLLDGRATRYTLTLYSLCAAAREEAAIDGKEDRLAYSRLVRATTLVALTLLSVQAEARPEKVRPGMSYYSDEYLEQGLVRDIVAEMNYEEVYQFYTYYEVIYDDAGRPVVFIEYKRGDELRRDEYTYGPDGKLRTRTVKRPGEPPETTTAD